MPPPRGRREGSRVRLVMLVLLAAAPGLAADLPPEVAAFVARRDRCDHFRGEESDDPARSRRIQRELAANCRGTDLELARLKRLHAGRPDLRAMLDRYDAHVE
jgi:hypothetical protein